MRRDEISQLKGGRLNNADPGNTKRDFNKGQGQFISETRAAGEWDVRLRGALDSRGRSREGRVIWSFSDQDWRWGYNGDFWFLLGGRRVPTNKKEREERIALDPFRRRITNHSASEDKEWANLHLCGFDHNTSHSAYIYRWKQQSLKHWLKASCSRGCATPVWVHSLLALITRLVSLIEGEL